VEIAGDGDAPRAERVILAATADHVVLDGTGRLHYTPEPLDHPYRPSVDVFFSSPVEARAAPGVAVLLTGMGRDGAAGLVGLRSAGWHTVAQDKATSVVWGMPGAAVEIGAAVETLPVDGIGAAIATRMPARCGETRRTP
jgi:two-component system response regulator WspF